MGELNPKIKAIVEKYSKQPPFANQDQRLLGTWNGVAEDADFKSYWNYDRRGDGTMRSDGFDLITDAREYAQFGFDVVWLSRGRVIFEQKASEPENIDIYLIESLDDGTMKYRIVFADEAVDTWAVESDQRGLREFPKPPAGWKKLEE